MCRVVVNMDMKPVEIDSATAAFPASVAHLMPKREDIPAEFKRHNGTKWNRFAADWFFSGIKATGLIPKEGIDKNAALRHLSAIQRSFEPKHEHKESAVAYLASLWFDDKSVWS